MPPEGLTTKTCDHMLAQISAKMKEPHLRDPGDTRRHLIQQANIWLDARLRITGKARNRIEIPGP